MRLLLDEHFSWRIADQLRRRGHDVEAVVERRDLARTPDSTILAAAIAERRAVGTENSKDYVVLAGRSDHWGLILTSPRSLPRHDIGRLVRALGALVHANPDEDALLNQVRWLEPPDGNA